MKHTTDIDRGIQISIYNSDKSYSIKSLLVLSVLNLALPAMSCGCEDLEPHQSGEAEDMIEIVLKSAGGSGDTTAFHAMDLFMFDEKRNGTLDSYQREVEFKGNAVSVASRSGSKRLFACVNGHWGKDDWMNVNSIEALSGFKADMENETYGFPVMTAEVRFNTGSPPYDTLRLRRLASEIRIRSIKADFSGKGYADEPLTDAVVYLVNVNASCSINAEGVIMPERIINHCRLDPDDLSDMLEPGLIFRTVGHEITSEPSYPDIRFRTFPNTCPEESPGSPFTRLVIEGRIKGKVYYWPIDIGREEGMGIERNSLYIYDITIRSKGSDDPDRTLSDRSAEFILNVKEWEEQEESRIVY